MNARDYAHLVQTMRAAQRQYFVTRTAEALDKSKTLERAVDAATREVLNPQPGLFPAEEEAPRR